MIEITNLSKFYGKARGIENINLSITEGEIFGFIGPNGAGKSTTIRILMNMIFPTSGSARIMGMDVIKDTKKIKFHTGYIPSDANAYLSMTVHEFLLYCLHFYNTENGEKRIADLTEMFSLDTTRKIAELSLGNRKKVSIIQSLLHSPRLLILDEPTTGLDPLMQSVFFDLLKNENKRGMTIFFSSHILGEVQMLCRRVAIIRDGKIIQVEDIDNLRKKQLKKISIEFPTQSDKEGFKIPGVETIIAAGLNTLTFMYSGSPGDLIGFLAARKVINLTIEEPSLDEIFLHYYKNFR